MVAVAQGIRESNEEPETVVMSQANGLQSMMEDTSFRQCMHQNPYLDDGPQGYSFFRKASNGKNMSMKLCVEALLCNDSANTLMGSSPWKHDWLTAQLVDKCFQLYKSGATPALIAGGALYTTAITAYGINGLALGINSAIDESMRRNGHADKQLRKQMVLKGSAAELVKAIKDEIDSCFQQYEMSRTRLKLSLLEARLTGQSLELPKLSSDNMSYCSSLPEVELPDSNAISPDVDMVTNKGCLPTEEIYAGLCYKKCELLTDGTHPYRSATNTCCKSINSCLWPSNLWTSGLGCNGFGVSGDGGCAHAPVS
eukprot:TRINITY_DN34896_c0_g1_i1.p1 TRINITY_DN34896_c0_g1~~TRINITY_DN34896_c0_g1_i1.p1  ORF type:complete len:335 (-),score=46.71 TRINITY_DN34896_c0_g1_i1:20-955(-)